MYLEGMYPQPDQKRIIPEDKQDALLAKVAELAAPEARSAGGHVAPTQSMVSDWSH